MKNRQEDVEEEEIYDIFFYYNNGHFEKWLNRFDLKKKKYTMQVYFWYSNE